MRRFSTVPTLSKAIILSLHVTLLGCQDTGTNTTNNRSRGPILTAGATEKFTKPVQPIKAPEPHSTTAPEPHSTKGPEPHSTKAPEPHSTKAPEPHSTKGPEPRPVTLVTHNEGSTTLKTQSLGKDISKFKRPRKEIRIGIFLPLSGRHAFLGQKLLDAAMLAFFSKSVDNYLLMPFDTQGTREGAANAAQRGLESGINLAIGPIFSDSVIGAGPVFRRAGISVLALSNNRAVAQPGVYLAGLFPETQINRLIRYAAEKGRQRLAVLVPTGQFGTRILKIAQAAVNSAGIKLVGIEYFDGSEESIAHAIRQMSHYNKRRATLLYQRSTLKKQANEGAQRALARLKILETLGPVSFDSLLIAASGQELVNVGAQLGNFDVDTKRVQLLGMASWAAKKTGAEPSLVGGWFTSIPFQSAEAFSKRYRATFQSEPHPLSAMAYDLIALATILGSPEPPRYDEKKLISKTGFSGASGLFRFLEDGQSEHSLEIRQILPRGSKVVDAAPKSFRHH